MDLKSAVKFLGSPLGGAVLSKALGSEAVGDFFTLLNELKADPKVASMPLAEVWELPTLRKYRRKYLEEPEWRTLKCPRCATVLERNIRNPSPCICGFGWDSAPLQQPSTSQTST
jgi:hypothetical protein